MKAIFIILNLLFVSNILCLDYTELSLNKLHNIDHKDKELNYFKFSLKDLKVIPNEITIQTELVNQKEPSSPIIGVYYEPIKLKNYKDLLKTELGKQINLTSEFIKSALERNEQIYFAVFSKNSKYTINIVPKGEMKYEKKFVQIPQVRSLAQEGNLNLNEKKIKSNETRLDFYAGDGLNALLVALILIFVSIIATGIMMSIYVHTTALVEQPLKLGKIEA